MIYPDFADHQSVKQWTANTDMIGITSKQGKNGGTLAHPDIACEFNIWINPAFRLDVAKKFSSLW